MIKLEELMWLFEKHKAAMRKNVL